MIHFSKTHFKRFQMMQKSMQSNRFENFCNIPTTCAFIGRPLSGDGAENLTSEVATKRVDQTRPC